MQQEQDTIGVLLGIITYLRCFFSEESFEDASYDKLKLKRLKNTTETTKLLEWINSIKKYQDRVHKVIFGVYRKNEKENQSVSGIKQTKEDPTHFNNQVVNKEELVEVYSISLDTEIDIKSICKAIQNLNLLTGKFSLRLKVYTSAYVEIKGFKRTDEIWDVSHLSLSDYNGFKIFLKSNSSTISASNNDPGQEQNFCSEISNQEMDKKYMNENRENLEKERKIMCCCTINIDDCCVIQCFQCKHFVHCCCHGFFSDKDKRIRDDFRCYCCIGQLTANVRNCSLYRRCLFLLYNTSIDHVSTKTYYLSFLKNRNYISDTLAYYLFIKLKSDGFFKKNCNSYELVMNKEIKEKIKEYFNGKKTECLISMGDIACSVE